jgi:hypothetical protein
MQALTLLKHLLAFGQATLWQKRLDQFAFPADLEAGEILKPLPAWNLRVGLQPVSQRGDLSVGDAPLASSVDEMDKPVAGGGSPAGL